MYVWNLSRSFAVQSRLIGSGMVAGVVAALEIFIGFPRVGIGIVEIRGTIVGKGLQTAMRFSELSLQ